MICPDCGHLNGGHEDTDAFVAQLYTNSDSKGLASDYRVEDVETYRRRVADIYLPKIDFLMEALHEEGLSPDEMSYADLGAGSGYLVQAFLSREIEKVIGYEVSPPQVALANAMIPGERIKLHSLDEISEIAGTVCADVVTLIGVIQHLRHPQLLLESLRENSNVRYIYFSVPIFSPCIFFEMVFSSVMQRQLSGGHTHLYTESSIDWFAINSGSNVWPSGGLELTCSISIVQSVSRWVRHPRRRAYANGGGRLWRPQSMRCSLPWIVGDFPRKSTCSQSWSAE